MGYLEYSSNNSPSATSCRRSDWLALEREGWVVHWFHDADDDSHEHAEPPHNSGFYEHYHSYSDPLVPSVSNGTRRMGALATGAAKEVNSAEEAEEALREFESVTGQSADDPGCSCCGPPHNFSWTDDKEDTHYFDSSPSGYDRSWS